MDDDQRERTIGTRVLHIGLGVAIAAAVVGYFTGLREGVPRLDVAARGPAPLPISVDDAAVAPALGYDDLRAVDLGPNRDWKSTVASLPQPDRDLFEEIVPDAASKEAALVARAALRAFNGAPPVVPHAVEQRTSAACLVCHENAMRIADANAVRPPHPAYANCLQCHVEQASRDLAPAPTVASRFTGLAPPFEGPRAWPGAPPQIPHTTQMRSECLSCHGPAAPLGLRTTHPWRASCLQCHAPSAALDQVFAAGDEFFPPSGGSATP